MKIFDVKCRGTIDTQLFVLPKQLPQFVSPWLTIVHGTIMECIDFASIIYRRLKNVLNISELLKNYVTETFLNPLSLISTRPFHIVVDRSFHIPSYLCNISAINCRISGFANISISFNHSLTKGNRSANASLYN